MFIAKGYPEPEGVGDWLYEHFWRPLDWMPGIPLPMAAVLLILAFCGLVMTLQQIARSGR